jgi:FAD/FMN-containing dehydrogenase
VLFGHAGNGGLRINVAVGSMDDAEHVTGAVLRLVAELDGSVGAERGIGVDKVRWLGLARPPEEIDVMRRIKAALDPRGTLNPGVMLG